MFLATKVVIVHPPNSFLALQVFLSTTARAFGYFIGYQVYQTFQNIYNLEKMAVAFMKMLDPARRAHPTHRPYAGPASAFLKSPPASALPWPKFIKSSTPESKSLIIDSPYTTPASPLDVGKQSDPISPHSAHEITTTEGETTRRYLSPTQTN